MKRDVIRRDSVTHESWAVISWAGGLYEVSNLGRVRSADRLINKYGGRRYKKRGRILRSHATRDGYLLVTLCFSGQRKTHLLHRLVYEFHCGNLIDGLDVAHRDGNKRNNHSDNFVQCSRAENISHQLEHGTRLRGEAKPASKLCAAEVAAIRAQHTDGASYRSLAKKYRVSHHTIGSVCRGETWQAAA